MLPQHSVSEKALTASFAWRRVNEGECRHFVNLFAHKVLARLGPTNVTAHFQFTLERSISETDYCLEIFLVSA